MEQFDIVDENGQPTGETVERTFAHENGIRHRAAHIWIARKGEGGWQVLLQKRSMDKDSFPGMLDTSSAGHIQAGDEPLESAIRELFEELGIAAQKEELHFAGMFQIHFEKPFHGRIFKDYEIAYVYIYTNAVEIEQLTLQKEEVETVAWFDLEDVYQACQRHDERFCVPIEGLEIARKYLAAKCQGQADRANAL